MEYMRLATGTVSGDAMGGVFPQTFGGISIHLNEICCKWGDNIKAFL